MRTSLQLSLTAAALAIAVPAAAQSSPTYRLEESVLNSGGRPLGGAIAASTSFRVTHDAIGDAAADIVLSSPSFRSSGGFVPTYGPPGEVWGVHWPTRTQMTWSGQPAAMTYHVYRGDVTTLPGSFGACEQREIPGTSAGETSDPPTDRAWYYLVTARNRLYEEGTKGWTSGGIERSNPSPCP